MNWHDYFTHDNGNLVWKRSGDLPKQWNKRYAGRYAGTISDSGYVIVLINKRKFRAHRIIWEMSFGVISEGLEIDHINKIRNDNRIENLRVVSHSKNLKNTREPKDNTSGFVGVYLDNRCERWYSKITSEGKTYNLGYFESFESACECRKKKEIELGFHETDGV